MLAPTIAGDGPAPLDGRTLLGREHQDDRNALADHCDGWDVISRPEATLIDRIAAKRLICTAYEAAAFRALDGIAASGSAPFAAKDWLAIANSLRHDLLALEQLAQARRAKGAGGLDLGEYLRAHAETAPETAKEPVCATQHDHATIDARPMPSASTDCATPAGARDGASPSPETDDDE